MSIFGKLFKKEQIRTRFAPSPTGVLHIGSARTTLFNFLFAKKFGGKFILRIEDTDLERSSPEFEKDIVEGLQWLGLVWDEGPGVGGPHGPYRQSERLDTYAGYLEKLLDSGDAFYCFHSKEFLEKEYQEQLAKKKNPAHICEFRKFLRQDAEKRLQKEPAIIRLKVLAGVDICFSDLIRGEICFNSNTLGGDFSLAKASRPGEFLPLYNFAVVVDDLLMKITHVILGEDHISNTPKQILISRVLDFSLPQYAHLPLILGPDKSKLSKRHGAVSVGDYRDMGYLPEALVNFTSLLGWNPGTDKEIFSLEELAGEFDMAKVQKGGAVFNIDKLDWLNGHYLRQLEPAELARRAVPYLAKQNFINLGNYDSEYIKKVITLEQPRLKKLGEVGDRVGFFFKKPQYESELLVWRDMLFRDVMASFETSREALEAMPEENWTRENLEKVLLEKAKEAKKGDKGRLLWPLRAALSGLEASPGPFDILDILGKQESIARIDIAIKKLK